MKVNFPHVVRDTDRHGNARVYYRRKGKPKVRLFETPGTIEFQREYEEAKAATDAEPERGRAADAIVPGSLKALCWDYFESGAFKILGASTRRARRGILESICASKAHSGIERGRLTFKIEPRHVEEVRDEKLADDTPEAANGRVKALRQLYKWARKVKKVANNPALEVNYISTGSDGHHTWTVGEVRQYEEAHPIGTTARLALALMLFTGVRRSDVVRLGPRMERDGWLYFTETKNAESKVRSRREGAKRRELPVLPELRDVIAGSRKTGAFTYLVSELGKPYGAKGFGNRFKKWCRAAGLPERCTAHGLRKAGASIAADNGATEHQLMAIYGWDSPKQAALYTRKVNRRRLAADAMHLLVPRDDEERTRTKVSHQRR